MEEKYTLDLTSPETYKLDIVRDFFLTITHYFEKNKINYLMANSKKLDSERTEEYEKNYIFNCHILRRAKKEKIQIITTQEINENHQSHYVFEIFSSEFTGTEKNGRFGYIQDVLFSIDCNDKIETGVHAKSAADKEKQVNSSVRIVKVINNWEIENRNTQTRAMTEYEFKNLQKTDHSHAKKPVYAENNIHFIVMKKHPGVPLSDIIENKILQQSIQLKLMLRMIHVLESHVFQHLIVHRDIKPENILVDLEKMHINIIDYGTATQYNSKKKIMGSPLFIAPEVVKNNSEWRHRYQYASDIYAMGIVWAMLIGIDENIIVKQCGLTANNLRTHLEKFSNALILEINKTTTIKEDIKSILCGMINPNPNERLTIEVIIKMLENINKKSTLKCSRLNKINDNSLIFAPLYRTSPETRTQKHLSQSMNESSKPICKTKNRHQHNIKSLTQSQPTLNRYSVKMFKEKSTKKIQEPLNLVTNQNLQI